MRFSFFLSFFFFWDGTEKRNLRVKSHLCYNLDSASSILPLLDENMPLGFSPVSCIYYPLSISCCILWHHLDPRVEGSEGENYFKPTCMYNYQLPYVTLPAWIGAGLDLLFSCPPRVGVCCDNFRMIWLEKGIIREPISPFYSLPKPASICDARLSFSHNNGIQLPFISQGFLKSFWVILQDPSSPSHLHDISRIRFGSLCLFLFRNWILQIELLGASHDNEFLKLL